MSIGVSSSRLCPLRSSVHRAEYTAAEPLTLTPRLEKIRSPASNDSTTSDENSSARVNHVSSDTFIRWEKENRTAEQNGTEKIQPRIRLHIATRDVFRREESRCCLSLLANSHVRNIGQYLALMDLSSNLYAKNIRDDRSFESGTIRLFHLLYVNNGCIFARKGEFAGCSGSSWIATRERIRRTQGRKICERKELGKC